MLKEAVALKVVTIKASKVSEYDNTLIYNIATFADLNRTDSRRQGFLWQSMHKPQHLLKHDDDSPNDTHNTPIQYAVGG